MYERWGEPAVLPYITGVNHGPEGLVVEFSQGARVFYQTGLLWEMREYDADVPAALVRGLVSAPALFH